MLKGKNIAKVLTVLMLAGMFTACTKNDATENEVQKPDTKVENKQEKESKENTDTNTDEKGNDTSNNHEAGSENIMTYEGALELLDAKVTVDLHSNFEYADDFLNCIVNKDTSKLAMYIGGGAMDYGDEGFTLFNGTEFDGFEIYPIKLSEKYDDGFEDYLVNLKVLSTDTEVLTVGDNYKILRSPTEYGIFRFEDINNVIKEKEYKELDGGIRIISSALKHGLTVDYGKTESDTIDISNNILHSGYHAYTSVYGEKPLVTLNEINEFLTAHVNGFKPFNASDIVSFINEFHFMTNEMDMPKEYTPDTPLYGCTAGHGGSVYTFGYDGCNESKYEISINYTLYADPMGFFPADKVIFTFDNAGTSPKLMSVERISVSEKTPFSAEF